MRRPVLYQEGEAHQKQRQATARFFAPRVVATRYRALMEALSDTLVADLRATGRARLDAMSLALAAGVAAEIVGLTESARDAMARRLDSFFTRPRREGFVSFVAGQARVLRFYLFDVAPAIRAAAERRAKT